METTGVHYAIQDIIYIAEKNLQFHTHKTLPYELALQKKTEEDDEGKLINKNKTNLGKMENDENTPEC